MRLLAAILIGVFLTVPLCAGSKGPSKSPPKPTVGNSAYDDREAMAKLQAMDIFPDMEKEDSDFANALSAEVECLECEQPDFFKSPAWPLHAARRVAARLGVKPLTVAEIRKRVAETFELKADEFQQVHGMQMVSARFSAGGDTVDVTPQLAARVTADGFTVDCDGSLLAALTEESQVERNTDEKDADYWKRQRTLLAAVADARAGQEALRITFEFHSETFNVAAKSGERIAISEEGKVTVGKIAPAARAVTLTTPAKAQKKPARSAASPPSGTTGVRDVKR